MDDIRAEVKLGKKSGNSHKEGQSAVKVGTKDSYQPQRLGTDPSCHGKTVMCPRGPGYSTSRKDSLVCTYIFGQTKVQKHWIKSQCDNKTASYGRTAQGIVEANPESYAEDMPDEEKVRITQDMLDAFWSKYEGIKEYMDRQIATAHTKGVLRTPMTGRKRRLTGVDWFFSEQGLGCSFRRHDLEAINRYAMNFRVQSMASDELSKATFRVWEGMKTVNIPNFRILMTLHDQLLFNVHKDYAEEAGQLIQKWMNTILPAGKNNKYEMPLTVDVDQQIAWGLRPDGVSEY